MNTITYTQIKPKLTLASAMFIFGTIGIFRKYIPLPSSVIALSRGVIGTLFLLLAVLLKKDKISFKAVKNNLWQLILSGILIGFNWIFLFEAYRYTTVATATLCYYMAPIFVILASPLILKEKLTCKKIICVNVALIGMVFVSGILQTGFSAAKELKGVLLGLMAALFYAVIILINKKIQNISAYDKTILQLGSAAIVLLPYTLLTENISSITITPFVGAMLCITGVVHTGVAYAIYFSVMDKLKAQTVALFSYIDPVVAIILSALFLREKMNLWSAVGAILVLSATLISEMPEKKP